MTEDTHQQAVLKKVIQHSTFETPCDVLILQGKPHTNAKISPKYGAALMYGAGAAKMAEMFETLEFQSGEIVRMNTVWDILPMPKEGFTPEKLDAVDLAEGEAVGGPNGETVRQMIKAMYHTETEAELELALRRFLAS